MLWTLALVLLLLWLAGFALHVGGNLIHLLLAAALILLVYTAATGRKSAT